MVDRNPPDNCSTAADVQVRGATTLGVLAGGGMFLLAMLLLAAVAISLGLFQQDRTGRLNLGPWIYLEVAGGIVAGLLAGRVCRGIAGSYIGPVVLAGCLFTLSLLETAEITRHIGAGHVAAPRWLVWSAPMLTAVSVLIGGCARGPRRRSYPPSPMRTPGTAHRAASLTHRQHAGGDAVGSGSSSDSS